ncbi:MAG: hypothetical protein ACFFCJ_04050 [Promethearchaeota archaeon]
MLKKGSRRDASEPIFFILFVVSPLILTGILVFGFLSNTLFAVTFARPWVIAMLIWCYVDARTKPGLVRGGVKLVVTLIFSFITVFLMTSLGPIWTPYYFLASFVFAFTAMFLGTLTVMLCEVFLKPKIELIRRGEHHGNAN